MTKKQVLEFIESYGTKDADGGYTVRLTAEAWKYLEHLPALRTEKVTAKDWKAQYPKIQCSGKTTELVGERGIPYTPEDGTPDYHAQQAWDLGLGESTRETMYFGPDALWHLRHAASVKDDVLEQLRAEIEKRGSDAPVKKIIADVSMGRQRARDGLRQLERLGEYKGFTRKRSARYTSD